MHNRERVNRELVLLVSIITVSNDRNLSLSKVRKEKLV